MDAWSPFPVGVGEAAPARAVFVSPHADDAVWSCGGAIAAMVRRGVLVTVVTVFAGEPDDLRGACGEDAWRRIATPRLRRLENARALNWLGVESVPLRFIDAALRARGGKPLYGSPQALFGEPHPLDLCLVREIAQTLQALEFRPVAAHYYAPLAQGDHVDHVLTRAAVLSSGLGPCVFYEDFPYARHHARPLLRPWVLPVDLDLWLTASLRYRSQVLALFGSSGAFRSALEGHAAAAGAEADVRYGQRFWLPTAAR